MGPMRLYRASDALMAHRDVIEKHLFDRAMDLFEIEPTVTLHDLTTLFFEGKAPLQPKALRGHSKDKRTDCPLLTLGLVLDSGGFVRRSQVFAGNVREHHTLARMLDALNAPRSALVVMDRGFTTEERLQWLHQQRYPCLVVSRERNRHFNPQAAQRLKTASRHGVQLHKALSQEARRCACTASPNNVPPRNAASSSASPGASRTPSTSSPKVSPDPASKNVWSRSGNVSGGSGRALVASPSTTTSHATPMSPDNAPPPCASPAALSPAR